MLHHSFFGAPYQSRGFTLLELVVTISIIAILSTVLVASFGDSRAQARDAERQTDLRTMQTAIELYRQKHGQYPAMGSICVDGDGWSPQSCAIDYIAGLEEFLTLLPKDPFLGDGDGYVYRTNADRSVYKLMARDTVESVTVTTVHPFQSCDLSLCTATCTGSADYSSSFAVWGGFADGTTEAAVQTNTASVVCQP